MNAVIIAGGEIKDYNLLKDYIKKSDIVICADRGYDHLKKTGLKADVVLGDMDSARCVDIEEKKILYPRKKDLTDSEISIDYAVEHGYKTLYLFAFLGTRMDHTINNISLLFKYDNIDAKIIDEKNEIIVMREKNVLSGKEGDIVSIIPFGEDIKGVTTYGLEYPLSDEDLIFSKSRGVSNLMTDNECVITKKSGKGLIIKSID